MTHHPAPTRNTATPRSKPAPTGHHRRGGRQVVALVGLLGALAILAVAITGVAHAQTIAPPATPTALARTTGLLPLPLSPTPTSTVSGDQPPTITLDPSAPASSIPAPASPPPDQPSDQCAWWQIGCQALNSINQWFIDLADRAVAPVLDLFSHSVLVTPDVTTVPQITQLWTITRWIANSVFVLFVMAGGFVVAAHETLQTRHALREIAPRIVVGFLAVNTSLAVIGQAITVINAVTTALLGQDSMDGVATNIKITILGQLHQDALYAVLIALIVLVLTVILLASYAVRVALLVIVVAAAPLALACHASPYTEGIARLWWRILIALLVIPALQAITLIVFVRIFFSPSASDMLTVGGSVMGLIVSGVLVFILIKIPNWVLKCAGLQRRSAIASIIKVALLAKGLGMLTGGRLGSHPPTPGGRRPPRVRRGTTPPPSPAGGSGAAQPPPDPDTPLPSSGPRQPGGPIPDQRPGQRDDQKRQDTAARARAAAIRAWSAPRAQAALSGRTRRDARTPTAPGTPARIPTTARRSATTPISGARTPPRIGTTPAASVPVPRRQATTRPAPITTTAQAPSVTPSRISAPPARASSPPQRNSQRTATSTPRIVPGSVAGRPAPQPSASPRTGTTPLPTQKPQQGGDRDA